MNEHIVDARGLSCPEPVLLVRQTLNRLSSGGFMIMVSNATARDNVTILLENSGFSPNIVVQGDEWQIQVPKK